MLMVRSTGELFMSFLGDRCWLLRNKVKVATSFRKITPCRAIIGRPDSSLTYQHLPDRTRSSTLISRRIFCSAASPGTIAPLLV